jgi:hypothetical protein
MIRLYDEQKAQFLYEMYEDSITVESPDISDWTDELNDRGQIYHVRLQTRFDFPVIGKLIGSIRILEFDGNLIQYLVMGQRPDGMFAALKVNSFTDLGTRSDPGFSSYHNRYIAEMDNSFPLTREEVEASVVLDEIDTYTFIQLEGALEQVASRHPGLSLPRDLNKWQKQFRLKEHEITCHFRSRDIALGKLPIWIPGLELDGTAESQHIVYCHKPDYDLVDYMSKEKPSDKSEHDTKPVDRWQEPDFRKVGRQADMDLPKLADKLSKPPDRGTGEDFSLHYQEGHLIIQPGREYIGKPGSLYSGGYCVFSGNMPDSLMVSSCPRMPLEDLRERLELSFRPR